MLGSSDSRDERLAHGGDCANGGTSVPRRPRHGDGRSGGPVTSPAPAWDSRFERFATRIGHDLRGPLNAVIGFSEILESELSGPLSDDQKECAAMVQSSARTLLEVIDDTTAVLKALARPPPGEDRVELRTLVGTAVAKAEPASKEKGVRVCLGVIDGAVATSPGGAQRVVDALVAGAVACSPPGGTVDVVTRLSGRGGVVVETVDEGPGVEPDEATSVFMPFPPAGAPRSAAGGSTGLKMYAAECVASQLGARLDCATRPDGKTVVTFSFGDSPPG